MQALWGGDTLRALHTYVCIYVHVHRAPTFKKRRFWKASTPPDSSKISCYQEASSACVLTQVFPLWEMCSDMCICSDNPPVCVFSSLFFPQISLYSPVLAVLVKWPLMCGCWGMAGWDPTVQKSGWINQFVSIVQFFILQSPSPQRSWVHWARQVSEDAQCVFCWNLFASPGKDENISCAVVVLPFSVFSQELAGLLAHASCEEKLCSSCRPCDNLSYCFFWVSYLALNTWRSGEGQLTLAGRSTACSCFLLSLFHVWYVWTLGHREKISSSADTNPINSAK